MSAPLSSGEITERRRLTTEMIAANPSVITLVRTDFVDDGAGGLRRGPDNPQPPQVVRVIALNREVPSRTTVDGREVTPTYRLLADWDANVQRGDWYEVDGVRYEVVWVEPDHLDATRAELVYGV